ncbi:MAG: hypothetical protein IPL37_09595 [Austwickia sp.]|nr:hypothetical protein [Austwickia sp.]
MPTSPAWPEDLTGRPFTPREARTHGIGHRRLTRVAPYRPHPALRSTNPHNSLVQVCRALLPVLPTQVAFSHVTAVGAAEAQIEAVTSDAAEQIAAATARAVRAEQAQRQAMADTQEADAAASEATARVVELEAVLTQVRAEMAQLQDEHEQVRGARDAVGEELGQARGPSATPLRRRVGGWSATLLWRVRSSRWHISRPRPPSRPPRRSGSMWTGLAPISMRCASVLGSSDESLATITAERDAARAEVERERAHGDQRVSDLHETYTRQIADLRGHAADTNEPPPQARRARIKRPSSDAG